MWSLLIPWCVHRHYSELAFLQFLQGPRKGGHALAFSHVDHSPRVQVSDDRQILGIGLAVPDMDLIYPDGLDVGRFEPPDISSQRRNRRCPDSSKERQR